MRSLFIKGQKGHLEEKKGDIFLPASLLSSSLGKTAKIETQWRSEEHTSELQSQSNLVCRLLLEKKNNIMETLHDVITFLVSMQLSISRLQTYIVYSCVRSRQLARKRSLRRKRSNPNCFEKAATETITSIIVIKLIKVSLGTVRHPRRFKIVVIDIQITLKQIFFFYSGVSPKLPHFSPTGHLSS